jgi:hypothetical protein
MQQIPSFAGVPVVENGSKGSSPEATKSTKALLKEKGVASTGRSARNQGQRHRSPARLRGS